MKLPVPDDAGPGYRVALIYPPFAPSGIASLGLALLSATLKARGIVCSTFYWNLELIPTMVAPDLASQVHTYRALTNRHAMPFNEWTFAEQLHGEALAGREPALLAELEQVMTAAYGRSPMFDQVVGSIRSLRQHAGDLLNAMLDRLAAFDLIGINSTFFQNIPALALAKAVKQRWPDKRVVMGGANCDGEMGPALAEKFPFLDAVFVGEADRAFPEFVTRLARADRFDDVAGIVYRDRDGHLKETSAGSPLEDLGGLPVPDFDDFVQTRERIGLDQLQELTLPLESSRGCWWGARHHCTFCGLNANGMGYRQKAPARFETELDEVTERYSARYVFMTDNIMSRDYLGPFMDRAAEADRPVRLFYEIKANMHREEVARLARAGITGVQPGIESFSSSILQLMRKGTTGIQNIAFLKYAREYGIFVAYNILVDFPGEAGSEYDRLAASMPSLVHLRPPSGLVPIEFHRFSPYHQDPARFGIDLRPSQRYEHLYPFPLEDIARIGYLFEHRHHEEVPDYLGAFSERLREWHESFAEDDCTLVWVPNGLDVLVTDRRPGFPRRTILLTGYVADLFHSLDRPKSRALLVSEAQAAGERDLSRRWLSSLFADPEMQADVTIGGSAAEFVAEPNRLLDQLVAEGLLYLEDGRLLALPVRSDYTTADPGWLTTGV